MTPTSVYLLIVPLRSSEGNVAALSGPGHIFPFERFQHAAIQVRETVYELTRIAGPGNKKQAIIKMTSSEEWNAGLGPQLQRKAQKTEVGTTNEGGEDLAKIGKSRRSKKAIITYTLGAADNIWAIYFGQSYDIAFANCQTFCYLFARLIQHPSTDSFSFANKLYYLGSEVFNVEHPRLWNLIGLLVISELDRTRSQLNIKLLVFTSTLAAGFLCYELMTCPVSRIRDRWVLIAQEEMAARRSGRSLDDSFDAIRVRKIKVTRFAKLLGIWYILCDDFFALLLWTYDLFF